MSWLPSSRLHITFSWHSEQVCCVQWSLQSLANCLSNITKLTLLSLVYQTVVQCHLHGVQTSRSFFSEPTYDADSPCMRTQSREFAEHSAKSVHRFCNARLASQLLVPALPQKPFTAHAGPQGATLMSVLLKRIAGWMAEAAVYLQRCHVVRHQGIQASIASMEGLETGHDLGSIAQARQALQVKAMLRLLFLHSCSACCDLLVCSTVDCPSLAGPY